MLYKYFSHFRVLAILVSAASVYAQDVTPAAKAFQTWKEKRVSAEMSAEGNFIGIAFAVAKAEGSGVVVDIAIGTGNNVGNLGSVSFVVQQMLMKQDPRGKKVFERVGSPTTLNIPEIENIKSSAGSNIIADPRITLDMAAGASAIQITVKDGTRDSTVLIPVKDGTSTAMLVLPLS